MHFNFFTEPSKSNIFIMVLITCQQRQHSQIIYLNRFCSTSPATIFIVTLNVISLSLFVSSIHVRVNPSHVSLASYVRNLTIPSFRVEFMMRRRLWQQFDKTMSYWRSILELGGMERNVRKKLEGKLRNVGWWCEICDAGKKKKEDGTRGGESLLCSWIISISIIASS